MQTRSKYVAVGIVVAFVALLLTVNNFTAWKVLSEPARQAPGEDDTSLDPITILKPEDLTGIVPTPLPSRTPPELAIALTPGQVLIGNLGTPVVFVTAEPTPTINPEDPWLNMGIVDGIPWDSKQVAIQSDVVVLADVVESQSQWSTSDGKRPVNPHSSDNQDYIFTTTSVEVVQMLSGDVAIGDILHIRQNGGQVGEDKLTIMYGQPLPVVGQYLLLYLTAKVDPTNQTQFYTLQEQYEVDEATQMVTNPFFSKPLSMIFTEIEEVDQMKQEIREGRFTPPPPPTSTPLSPQTK